jgi:alkanesulfonate monooxygenase SsuD/methylene tetrahydromethanopterin reductase-like flavin-dependent oxidoreductase (luciferase family)
MSRYRARVLPALSLVATPGKRAGILDLARDAEARGFTGIACPSLGGTFGLCASLAHVTSTIPFWTSIQPIYLALPAETAALSAHIHEVSGGRFRLGLGVSHGPVHERLGVRPGRPLADVEAYVGAIRASGASDVPIVLATLRNKMLDLAIRIADGAVWANAARSHLATQLERIPAARRPSFFVGNMIPTVIDDDREAARAIHRRTLTGYVMLPNYRNYWKQAGYAEEMEAIEQALAAGDRERLVSSMSDRWLDDCTLSGGAAEVREGVEAWRAAGVTTPILVMSSTKGGQAKAVGELFDAYA